MNIFWKLYLPVIHCFCHCFKWLPSAVKQFRICSIRFSIFGKNKQYYSRKTITLMEIQSTLSRVQAKPQTNIALKSKNPWLMITLSKNISKEKTKPWEQNLLVIHSIDCHYQQIFVANNLTFMTNRERRTLRWIESWEFKFWKAAFSSNLKNSLEEFPERDSSRMDRINQKDNL